MLQLNRQHNRKPKRQKGKAMLFDIYEQNYYNAEECFITETREFETEEEAKAYCETLTEKAEMCFYFAEQVEDY